MQRQIRLSRVFGHRVVTLLDMLTDLTTYGDDTWHHVRLYTTVTTMSQNAIVGLHTAIHMRRTCILTVVTYSASY